MLPDDDLEGLAANSSRIIVFRLSWWNVHLSEKPEQRIRAEADRYGKRLALVKIFLAMKVAVMARRNVQRQGIAVMHHDAVAAKIDPPFIRIAADRNIESADVTTAVALVPERHG